MYVSQHMPRCMYDYEELFNEKRLSKSVVLLIILVKAKIRKHLKWLLFIGKMHRNVGEKHIQYFLFVVLKVDGYLLSIVSFSHCRTGQLSNNTKLKVLHL